MVNVSHFDTRPYRILNPKDSPDLQAFIDACEVKAMKAILGINLYNEYIEGLTEDPIEERWTQLRDGTTYVYNIKTYEYGGLIDLLRPYIFSEWVRENRDKFMSVGTVRAEATDTKAVSPDSRIIEAYNDYCDKVGGNLAQAGTLYGFLTNSEHDYSSLQFTKPFTLNKFGI